MDNPLRIDYLATFDTGNASIRWPQKNILKANRDQVVFDAEILSALKANLLLKPFISIRHFELFDNLGFAKFVSANNVILRRLSEANLIRPCSPLASSWEEICVAWALRNPDDPMHWHHLTPDDQRLYDVASRKRKITDLRSLEARLGLTEHKDANGNALRLEDMVDRYDEIFPPHRIIVTSASEPTRRRYADLVKRELDTYLKQRESEGRSVPTVVSKIAETVRKSCEADVLRRELYTKLEVLEDELRMNSGRAPINLTEEVSAAKAFVINEAFYKHFQQFDRYVHGREHGNACIVANRDVTETRIPPYEGVTPTLSGRDPRDAFEHESLPLLDEISLADILEWHTADHPEARSFRNSLHDLQRKNRKPSEVIRDHLAKIRDCARRTLTASGRADLLEKPAFEVYFGLNADLAAAGVTAGLFAMARYYFGLDVLADILAIVSVTPLTILFKKPADTYLVHHFEATLEDELRASLRTVQSAD